MSPHPNRGVDAQQFFASDRQRRSFLKFCGGQKIKSSCRFSLMRCRQVKDLLAVYQQIYKEKFHKMRKICFLMIIISTFYCTQSAAENKFEPITVNYEYFDGLNIVKDQVSLLINPYKGNLGISGSCC